MSVWDELRGQPQAVEVFRRAVAAGRPGAADPGAMTGSWLITGPPGSGRSTTAYAFAAALLCERGGCGECRSCAQVRARSHPDLTAVVTETVQLDIATARELVSRASLAPMTGRYRIIVVEDADRMVARTSNTLLKAIEEPAPTTVWVLCAPSEADLLPTIRSRVRTVGLVVPSVEHVAELLAQRDGVDPATALRAARQAQCHVGMARRLASDPQAAARRAASLAGVLGLRTTGEAVRKAAELAAIAEEDGAARAASRDERERAELLRSLGVAPGAAVPRQLRGAVRELEEHQKRRAKRAQIDGVDRILTDLQSLWRDVLMVALDAPVPLVNEEMREEIRGRARDPRGALRAMERIAAARARLAANVPPVLALEAMLIGMRTTSAD
ncbi:MAG: DNA polymerase III subunit delta' [Pseudoclavibacter sp.]|nr:DNA polymerase III subunit delta' [Pseudoclavibacter sp.]